MQITNVIKDKTSAIISFSQREAAAKKSEAQKKVDLNFTTAVSSVSSLVFEIKNASKESNFVISDSVKSQVSELLAICMQATTKTKVDTFDVNNISNKEKEIRGALQYEWTNYYNGETGAVEEVLGVIKGISNIDVNSLLNKMKAAKDWNRDVTKVKDMMSAITEANRQIERMKLTDNTVEFLRKVISKTATLEDITDEVMDWLKAESITGKVKISF